ncbi:MAG: hypothetical protein LBR17_08450 [Bacteroidales bacterium]|jgi:hypothetical protein|nr:hypothetical protein [Bacteroidales bacterium]
MTTEWVFKSRDEISKNLKDIKKNFTSVNTEAKKVTLSVGNVSQKTKILTNNLDFLKTRLFVLREKQAFAPYGKELATINKQIKQTQDQIKKYEKLPPDGFIKRLNKAGEQISGFRIRDLGLVFAANQLRRFGIESAKLYDVQAKANAQLKASLAGNGGLIGRSFEQLQNQASGLQRKTLFGDEQINSVQAILATFRNVRGEIFDKTIPAILDFSTKMKQEPTEAAKQLGKALNNPVKAITTLRRMQIEFSKEQQQAIKQNIAAGNLQAAQLIILEELQRRYGGSAEAAAKVGLGPLQQLKNQWSDLQEAIGAYIVSGLNKLIPIMSKVVDFMQKNIKTIAAVAKGLFTATTSVIAFYSAQWVAIKAGTAWKALLALKGLAISLFTGKIKAATTAFKAFNLATKANVLGLVVAGITAAITAFQVFKKRATTDIDTINKNAAKYASEERGRLDTIFTSLRKTNPGSKERNRLVKELQQMYPDLLKNMNLEQASLGKLEKSYQKIVAEITRTAKARAFDEQLTDLYRERNEYVQENADDIKQMLKYAAQMYSGDKTEATTARYYYNTYAATVGAKLDKIDKKIKDLQNEAANNMLANSNSTQSNSSSVDYEDYGGGSGSSGSGSGGRGRGIVVNIQNLISGGITVQSTNLQEGAEQIKRIVIQTLMDATNEFSAAG